MDFPLDWTDELLLQNGWPTKGVQPYFQLGPLSVSHHRIPPTRRLQDLNLFWIKLYRSYNHHTTDSWVACVCWLVFIILLDVVIVFIQSWTKYMWTFPRFNAISLRHKWIGTMLLWPKGVCTSCLLCCQTT